MAAKITIKLDARTVHEVYGSMVRLVSHWEVESPHDELLLEVATEWLHQMNSLATNTQKVLTSAHPQPKRGYKLKLSGTQSVGFRQLWAGAPMEEFLTQRQQRAVQEVLDAIDKVYVNIKALKYANTHEIHGGGAGGD